MASHHHCQCQHQHQHQHQQNHHHSTCCSSSNSCICSSSFHSQSHQPFYSPPSPQLSPSDPLVQAIATQLLQSSQSHLFNNNNKPHHHQQQHKHHKQQEQEKTQALFTSLLRRVVALESSFHHLSSSSPSPTHSSSSSPPPLSLRDIAARTIQTHFRAYLVRRSRTLRHLKHLAIIKSNLNSLKSSVSDNPHFNFQALSQKAMDLLHKLDFIQGGDPMIRDGKRSINRDLVRFLEFVDGISAKRQQLSSKSIKAVRFAGDIEESRVYMSTQEPLSCENVGDFDYEQGISSDDQTELVEKLTKKIGNIEGFSRVYEDDEETGSEGSSSKLSNGDRNPRINLKTKVNHGKGNHFQGQNGNSLYSAPLPVQMEPARDDKFVR